MDQSEVGNSESGSLRQRVAAFLASEESLLQGDLLAQASGLSMRSSIGCAPAIIVVVLSLWSTASHLGLLVWAALTATGALNFICLASRFAEHPERKTMSSWLHAYRMWMIVGGTLWGALPVLALPRNDSPEHQALVGLYVVSFMAANTIFSSPLRRLFRGFQIPIALVSALGFVLGGTTFGALLGGFVLFAFGFTVMLHHESNTFAVQAVRLSIGNALLLHQLQTERQRIEDVNANLTLVNQQLAFQAAHDSLTGASNRTHFADQLEAALARSSRSGQLVAVLFIDVDRFKTINDSLGHGAGDQVLVAVAHRIQECLRGGDVLARPGGDEFTVLVNDVADRSSAIEAAERICHAMRHPLDVAGRTISVTSSIGVAVNDHPADTSEDLLRNADACMYRAKSNGRDRVEACSDLEPHEAVFVLRDSHSRPLG